MEGTQMGDDRKRLRVKAMLALSELLLSGMGFCLYFFLSGKQEWMQYGLTFALVFGSQIAAIIMSAPPRKHI